MSTASPRPTAAPKILAPTSTRLRLAGISLGILVLGAVVAPRQANVPLPSPEQGPAPLLGEQMARATVVSEPFVGVQDVADRTRAHAVSFAGPTVPTAVLFSDTMDVDRPGVVRGFGVYVADELVLTHVDALGGGTDVNFTTADGKRLQGAVRAAEADTGLVLLQVPAGGVPATLAAGMPPAGALAVSTGHADDRDIAVPVFVTSVRRDRFTVGTSGAALPPGAPLFTEAGDLLAVASGTSRQGDVFPAAAAIDRLLAQVSNPTGVFGLTVQGLDGALAAILGDRGVVVTEAAAGGPAAEAGIAPGDIILAIGDTEVMSAQTAVGALTGVLLDQSVAFRVLRRGNEQVFDVTPMPAYGLAIAPRPPDVGPNAASVMSEDDLSASSIPGDALVLRVGATAVTSAQQARRLIAQRTGATAVLLSHNGVRFVTALPERP